MDNRFDEYAVCDKLKFSEWKRLFGYVLNHKKQTVILAVCCLLTAAADALVPYFSRYAFNVFVAEGHLNGLGVFAALYVAVALMQSFFTFIFCKQSIYLEMNVGRDMRNACYEKLQNQSLSYYNVTPVGYLLSRVLNDTNNIGSIFSWRMADMMWALAYLVFCVGSMFYLNAKLAVIVVTLFGLALVGLCKFDGKILRRNREARRINSILSASFNENISGAKTIKSLAVEDSVCSAFDGKNLQLRSKSIAARRLSAIFMPMIMVLGNIVLGIVLASGQSYVGNASEIGTLAVFATYSVTMIDLIQNITGFVVDLMATQVNVERVNRLLDAEINVVDSPAVIEKYGTVLAPKPEHYEPIKGDIEFCDVTFRYPDGNIDVLSHFDLKIKAGSMIAIVGETGAGKSTLVNLACRFFEPTGGKVLIDGVDYRERSLGWLHSSIGYVLQQPHLFSGTIRENICYSRPDATEEEMIAAAKTACAHDFIMGFKDGYDTDVGEGGDLLSTGQKQLISIARAIISNPAIFVLDEATSSVDTHTEQLISQVLGKVLEGRTSFVIAHRLSTIKNADLILMVEDGRIIEQGTHRQLLRQKGRYYALYSRQYENEQTDKFYGSMPTAEQGM
ncbi:MAG: ABC transporter ATP-binding protein [Clostridia bacterium]|nr:ABC transporter ATP-binding protein [Clostridia bacterium]